MLNVAYDIRKMSCLPRFFLSYRTAEEDRALHRSTRMVSDCLLYQEYRGA